MSGVLAASGVLTTTVALGFKVVVSADVTNLNLRTLLVNAGWNQTDNATVTINAGVVVSSNGTGTPALLVPSNLPTGPRVTIINKGHICGMGGGSPSFGTPSAGGPALKAEKACVVNNAGGVIAGGGGGGSNGGFVAGGGGQTGRTNSSGSPQGTFAGPGIPSGTTTGAGGAWGQPGVKVGSSNPGAGGAAVQGNSFITWSAAGTRYGAIT